MKKNRIAHLATLVALIAGFALVPAALGGKPTAGGGAGTASSLSLVMVDDKNADGLPNWGDDVTFNVSSTASYPKVQLVCSQGSNVVDNQTVGFYPGWPWSKTFPLYHWYYWPAGGADCTATLYYQTRKGNVTLKTLSFHTND